MDSTQILGFCLFLSVTYAIPLNEILTKELTPEVSTFCLEELRQAQTLHDYFPDPADCRYFYHCSLQGTTLHAKRTPCPEGQQWTREWKTCWTTDRPCQQSSQAIVDPCQVDTLDAFGFYSSGSCAEYYQCDNNLSRLRCCPMGLGWNQTALQCDYTPCEDTCSLFDPDLISINVTDIVNVTLFSNECSIGNYIYAPIEKSERQYILTSLDRTTQELADCPRSRPYFSVEECACLGPALPPTDDDGEDRSPTCVYFDYDQDLGESVAWIDNFGAKLRDDQLCFDSEIEKLEIPYYAMMDWNVGFFLGFSFKGFGSASHNQASLISNGNAAHNPTIEVVLLNGNITVSVITHHENGLCTVSLPVENFGKANQVSIRYDGSSDGVGLTLEMDQYVIRTPCQSDIEQSASPLTLGDGFVGCLDDIRICTST